MNPKRGTSPSGQSGYIVNLKDGGKVLIANIEITRNVPEREFKIIIDLRAPDRWMIGNRDVGDALDAALETPEVQAIIKSKIEETKRKITYADI